MKDQVLSMTAERMLADAKGEYVHPRQVKVWTRDEAAGYVSREYYAGKYADTSHEHLSRELHALPHGGYVAEDVRDMVRRMIRLRDVCKIIGH